MTIAQSARTAIVGVGHSAVYRRDDVSLGRLTLDAALAAVADAGLRLSDIEGVVIDPVQPFDGAGRVDGRNFVSSQFVLSSLGLDVTWHAEPEWASTLGAVIEGANAVASGNCRAVLALRALHNPSGRYGHVSSGRAEGGFQYTAPYGVDAPGRFAQLWTRYMHDYGTTREQMAPYIVQARHNGLLWEHGYWTRYKPEPLTVEDYLTSRMISDPISVLDCDIPVQGAAAFVITTADRAPDLRHRPAYVRGWAVPRRAAGSPHIMTLDEVQRASTLFAKHLYRNAGVGPGDIDVANLYDGFSIFVPIWLETLGFCGEGEAFDFMTPDRIGLRGSLPVNTAGGNLGAGRMHGVAQVMDSVLQVQGRSGPRQVPGAEVVLATAGGFPGSGRGIIVSSAP
ncbi:thiolase family protein [Nocardia nova]|uniref:thiolase family protein n=1 Tax=Nocardia nova TaxID=37330 RepID=UPI0033EC9175